MENFAIPLPPLEEQKRIAAIARKCDRLRRTRRFTQQLSNTYLQSVFHEMVGDPITNPFGWKVKKVGDICTKVTDGTHQPPQFTTSGIPFVFVQNIVDGEIDFDSGRYISEETYERLTKHTKIEKGDIVYSSVGATFGVAVEVRTSRKFAFQRHIAHLKPDHQQIDPSFLCAQMNTDYVYSQAQQAARGAAQPTLNLSEIRDFQVAVPPLNIQENIVKIFRHYERLRTQQREGDRQAEHLFQTVLHRAFQGEL